MATGKQYLPLLGPYGLEGSVVVVKESENAATGTSAVTGVWLEFADQHGAKLVVETSLAEYANARSGAAVGNLTAAELLALALKNNGGRLFTGSVESSHATLSIEGHAVRAEIARCGIYEGARATATVGGIDIVVSLQAKGFPIDGIELESKTVGQLRLASGLSVAEVLGPAASED